LCFVWVTKLSVSLCVFRAAYSSLLTTDLNPSNYQLTVAVTHRNCKQFRFEYR
jgi:hypothetical protein